jgi:hypothetical protein
MEAGKIHPSRRSFRLKKKTKDDIPSIPFLCRPEASAEGSLGACAPRNDMPGRRPERSVLWDAVPNEVRDASLSFGRTKKYAREEKVGGF